MVRAGAHGAPPIGETLSREVKPVICIGNIVTGGAGKNADGYGRGANFACRPGHKPVFVTRGYKGTSVKGPLQVDPESHSPHDVGDEALLLACIAPVWIGRDRAAAIKAAEKNATHIIMDDGLQNPNIDPHLSFLVIDGATGIGNGYVMLLPGRCASRCQTMRWSALPPLSWSVKMWSIK